MLVVGAVFVDVKGFARERYAPRERNVGDVQVTAGGVCRNVVENLCRLGCPVRFVSMVDDDAFGAQVRDSLASLGANVDHVIDAPGGMGMWLAILDEKGDLAGSISRQPNTRALADYLREKGDAIVAHARAVALEFDVSDEISDIMMALAEKHGKPVYAIVGNMSVILRRREYLHRVACFICNEMEAGRLFREDLTGLGPQETLEALKRGSAVADIPAMVVTMGPGGAVYVDNRTGEFGYCPPAEVTVVDTTGAGDAFFSAAVVSLLNGAPLSQAVQEGTRLAAKTLSVAGSCA
ncbi:MAG: carbohydrate kinase family protein [Clostridia bacterium]|nr:carbohydrate kinase family protein [Clostridia bacterium]